MLHRTRDAALLNSFANHPDVRPFVGLPDAGALDLSDAAQNACNVFLVASTGGFGAIWTAPHCFELHTFILPEGRGAAAIAAGKELIATLAAEYGARHLWTRIAREHRHTRLFARLCGMTAAADTDPLGYDLYEWRA